MPQITINIKSFELYYIENAIIFIKKIQFLLNNINIAQKEKKPNVLSLSQISLPKKNKLFTVLRSPHIDKKSREQFEFTYHKKKIVIQSKNNKNIALFVFLLKNSEFPGVELEISFFYKSVF